jgi:Secretion system C-terminal sorting domain
MPTEYEISQNYPNPFNPGITIRFSLQQATQIKINLYNMIGEQIASLAEGMYETGNHKVNFNASNLPSGAYIYGIESSDPSTGSQNGQAGQSFVQTKKMMLLK